MSLGGGKSAPTPVYTARDGSTHESPSAAAERDRQLGFAAELGYGGSIDAAAKQGAGNDFEKFIWNNPTNAQVWRDYYQPGLTVSDYRTDKRLADQAATAKAEEAQRQSDIDAGLGAIASAFSGFDNNYYQGVQDKYLNYYLPQLDDQFKTAKEKVTYDNSRRGVRRSQPGIDRFADLNKRYQLEKDKISNSAVAAANTIRSNIDSTKSNLQNFASTAADPGAVDNRLSSEISRVSTAAPNYEPLAQVFYDFITPTVNLATDAITAGNYGRPGFAGLTGTNRSKSVNVVGGV